MLPFGFESGDTARLSLLQASLSGKERDLIGYTQSSWYAEGCRP